MTVSDRPGALRTAAANARRVDELRLLEAEAGTSSAKSSPNSGGRCCCFRRARIPLSCSASRRRPSAVAPRKIMPFPRHELPRLRHLGDRILFGSDLPNIPYPYADAVRAVTTLAPGLTTIGFVACSITMARNCFPSTFRAVGGSQGL